MYVGLMMVYDKQQGNQKQMDGDIMGETGSQHMSFVPVMKATEDQQTILICRF